jgi:hypothetical protein
MGVSPSAQARHRSPVRADPSTPDCPDTCRALHARRSRTLGDWGVAPASGEKSGCGMLEPDSDEKITRAAMRLRKKLLDIFPESLGVLSAEDIEEYNKNNGRVTPHYVMMGFNDYFFVVDKAEFSKRQIELLAALINESVEDDALQNAMATVTMEHLHQVDRYGLLEPFLSDNAKKATHP